MGSALVKAATTFVVGLKGPVLKSETLDDALDRLEDAHVTVDLIDHYLAGTAAEIAQLRAALSVLKGAEEVTTNGALVEAAVSA
ncbi:hypothetical protein RA28_19650 [Ruegeria sp. ANG-S4]|uniref:hypothetical protein n=1 Tax=Ruegeria sp. ANG-S4 TaxID=1577904 RepID=UPI00057DEC68|nr:hypothetical protein [Ruegeria sp. ANG-S4]KIC43842.1 hypothetical protein RA28_19650 [Ruegeria sp. ANG-S4]